MPIDLTNYRSSLSLDNEIASTEKEIESLSTKIKEVNNSLQVIGTKLKLEAFDITYLTQLRENLETVKNKNPAKQTVYLHSSRGKGEHFSHHKGLAVRLHLGDQGYTQAVKNLKESGVIINSGAGKKIKVAEMRLHIDLALESHATKIANLKIRESASTEEKQVVSEQKEAARALSNELKQQRNRPQDLISGVRKFWGSNCGASYINGLCRSAASTFRSGAAIKKPGLAEVISFYRNSDTNSHINSFPQKAIQQVEKVLTLNDQMLLQTMDAALTEPSGLNTYFRGASLPDTEIQKYQDAYNSAWPIESSFFMAVTPEEQDARPFAKGKYSSHKDRPVMFTVIGNPFTADSAYEQESLFKPGSQFKVISIDTRSPTASIVLSEADQRTARAILV